MSIEVFAAPRSEEVLNNADAQELVVNLHAEPPKINTHGAERERSPQHVEPTHYCWCSRDEIIESRPIEDVGEFWQSTLDWLVDTPRSRPNYFCLRSNDGLTIFYIPVPTKMVWRGEC